MKRILITGANSYIGTNVSKKLLEDNNKYHIETLDMKDPNWVNYDFSNFDCIFHVAGIAHIKVSKKSESIYYRINRDLAFKTAEKAKNAGVKQFIFLSTMSVYGLNKGIITPNTKPNPRDAYGRSKYEAEQLISRLEDDNYKIVILRPPMVYGYNSPGNYNKLAKMSLKLPFYPKINNKRSMLYIENLAIYIKHYIDNDLSGLFFPQNKEYTNTSNLISKIRILNGKKVRSYKILNLIVYLLMPFSSSLKKIFQSLIYSNDINDEITLISFEESIKRSNNNG